MKLIKGEKRITVHVAILWTGGNIDRALSDCQIVVSNVPIYCAATAISLHIYACSEPQCHRWGGGDG